MRIMTAFFFLSAIGLVAADDAKKEETKLKGKWTAVSLKHAGQSLPDEALKTFSCTFEEKTYNNVMNGEVVEEGDFTIDDSKSPKTIDFDIKKGHDEGKKQIGIFKIDGDKMTIVVAEAGVKDRPTSFKIEEGSNLIEAVLERAKP
jgi:uncharacterized protein (TIGR03067 family)